MADIQIDETTLPEVHTLGILGRLKVKMQAVVNRWDNYTKNQKIAIGAAVLVVVIAVIAVSVLVLGSGRNTDLEPTSDLSKNSDSIELMEPEEPRDQESPLTGELLTQTEYNSVVSRSVLAVIVENAQPARPQSGIDKADIIFETLTEGGITRFIPLFLSEDAEVVGPVRSMRKYFLDFVAGYDDPLVMHIGYAQSSNPQANAIGELSSRGVKTLGLNGGTFWRVGDRSAPHNAYASTVTLRKEAEALGWNHPSDVTTWQFKDAEELTSDGSYISTIRVNWGAWGVTDWSVKWELDPLANVYKRFHVDDPHKEAVSGEVITANNVLVIYTNQQSANDGTARIVVDAMGNGNALLFRDGQVINGTWSKPTRTDRYLITGTDGNPVEFNRGNTWIMVVPLNSEVLYD